MAFPFSIIVSFNLEQPQANRPQRFKGLARAALPSGLSVYQHHYQAYMWFGITCHRFVGSGFLFLWSFIESRVKEDLRLYGLFVSAIQCLLNAHSKLAAFVIPLPMSFRFSRCGLAPISHGPGKVCFHTLLPLL